MFLPLHPARHLGPCTFNACDKLNIFIEKLFLVPEDIFGSEFRLRGGVRVMGEGFESFGVGTDFGELFGLYFGACSFDAGDNFDVVLEQLLTFL